MYDTETTITEYVAGYLRESGAWRPFHIASPTTDRAEAQAELDEISATYGASQVLRSNVARACREGRVALGVRTVTMSGWAVAR